MQMKKQVVVESVYTSCIANFHVSVMKGQAIWNFIKGLTSCDCVQDTMLWAHNCFLTSIEV